MLTANFCSTDGRGSFHQPKQSIPHTDGNVSLYRMNHFFLSTETFRSTDIPPLTFRSTGGMFSFYRMNHSFLPTKKTFRLTERHASFYRQKRFVLCTVTDVSFYLRKRFVLLPPTFRFYRRKRFVVPADGRTEQEGPIPPELSTCLCLEELYLHCNKLCGEIPDSLRSLRGLRYLYLHRVSRSRARTNHRRRQHKEAFFVSQTVFFFLKTETFWGPYFLWTRTMTMLRL